MTTFPRRNDGEILTAAQINSYLTEIEQTEAEVAAHVANTSNPHATTKAQVGLGNVDNTSDVNKPVSSAVTTALAGKANTSHTHPATDLTATGRTTTNYLRGDNTWATPTNTTYSVITLSEYQTGTATTARAISAETLKGAILYHTPAVTSTVVDDAGAVMVADTSTLGMGFVIDEDTMVTDSNTKVPTQQSVKAYVDTVAASITGGAPAPHTHDDRYYTESETNTLLAGKANTSHGHVAADIGSGTFDIARIPTGTTATTVSLGNHTHTASNVTDFQTTVSANTDVAANTTARHTHANKTTLDAVTAAYTTAEQTKLAGIAAGAEVNVQSDWNAVSGDAQILNKPATYAPSAHTHVATTDLTATGTKNTTTFLRGDNTWAVPPDTNTTYSALTQAQAEGAADTTAGLATGQRIAQAVVANATVAANTAARHTHANSAVLDATTASFTTADETKLDGIAAGAEVNVNADWNAATGDAQILNKPATFTPSAHTHAAADVTSGSFTVAQGGTGRATSTTAYGVIAAGTTATGAQQTIAPGTSGHFLKSAGASALAAFAAVTKTDVGLSNVDNTSDANKPVSTATQTALNGKANTSHTHVATTDLTATGTKDATTFLRGDNTWAVPANTTYSALTQAQAESASDTTAGLATGQRIAQAVVANSTVSTLNTSMNRMKMGVFNVKDYGAIGDGATHPLSAFYGTLAAAQVVYPHATALTDEIDWAAFQAAHNAMQGASGTDGGGTIYVPYGNYFINRTVNITKSGVIVQGAGQFSSVITATSAVTGPVFRYATASQIIRGCGMHNFRIDLAATTNVTGIIFDTPYDNNHMSNVMVHGIGGTGIGIQVIKSIPNGTMDVGEGFNFDNVMVWGRAGFTGRAWDITLLNEAVFNNCKGLTAGTGFYVDGCKGVFFLNCSVATVTTGWRFTAVANDCIGIVIDNPTVEGATTTIDADGNATYRINRLEVRSIRPEGTAGPINLDYCTLAHIEAGALTVADASTNVQTHIMTAYRGGVTASGAQSFVLEYPNGVNALASIRPGLEVLGGNVLMEGTWNTPHLVMAGWHFWLGSDGTFRKKAGAPTSALDGSLV